MSRSAGSISETYLECNLRTLAWLTLMMVQVPLLAAEPAAIPSASQPCESHDLTFDSKEIGCSLRTFSPGERLRLTVNFSGGHDDTMASMAVYIDDQVLVCDVGSKLRLMGEDGDVSLTCRFSVGAASRDQRLKSVVAA